jgi:hypothetical protein
VTGAGTARLKVQGYDRLDGRAEQAASTSAAGSWQHLTLTMTPTRGWVVVGLEGTGTGASGQAVTWDDVQITQ